MIDIKINREDAKARSTRIKISHMKTNAMINNKLLSDILTFSSFSIFLMANTISSGQTTVASGTTMKVVSGTSVTVNNQLTIQNGVTMDNEGTLILKDNLANQGLSATSLGGGAVILSGSSVQTVSGQNIIQNLTVSNSAGVTVAGNTNVNGVLTLSGGVTSLGNFNLMLGSGATVSGLPSSTNMIAATGNGQLQKQFSGTGSFTFPVGDVTGTAEYSPVTLAFNSGTFGSGNSAGVNLRDAQFPGTGISYLTRYWTVSQTGISGFSCNATFQYLLADVVGLESDIFSFKVDPVLPWTAYNASSGASRQLTAHGLSSFGTFTGNKGNSAVPPAIRSLQDKTISGSVPTCADASLTMLIAGNGTTYQVLAGGSVSHIAGQNIIYLPGTTVFAGGYLHGYISTEFCTPYIHPGDAPVVAGNGDTGEPLKSGDSFFRIYPNPTSGNFTLELKGDATSAQVHVDIFGILGEKIQSKDLVMERKQEFSLIDRPTGVYVVHVISGALSETAKIIKR